MNTVIAVTVGSVIIFLILWIILIAGRTDNEKTKQFKKRNFAHRGLVTYDHPENSLAAFKSSVEQGVGIELDVHMMLDSRLAVIHDSSLARTVGEDVKIESLTEAELKNYHLTDNGEKIPTLREVLETVDGRVPLLIELKSEGGNAKTLCSALCYELRDYEGEFLVESFDPRCVRWFRKNRPDIVRGQLAQNFLRRKENLKFPLRLILTMLILNCATQPDFIAFKFEDRFAFANLIAKSFWNMPSFVWTVRSGRRAKKAEREGYGIIFENLDLK